MTNQCFFELSVVAGTQDFDNVVSCYNAGIDSRLEGFTQSPHEYIDNTPFGTRLFIYLANAHEFQILVRRLLESGIESAEQFADSMVYVQYGYEVI